MSNRLSVHQNGKIIYDIIMENSFGKLASELNYFSIQDKKICLVADSKVAELYQKEVVEIIEPRCKQLTIFNFNEGEEYKNLDTVKSLYKVLIENHFDRSDMLIALGGGVTGDLCGFAAATYLRGVSFIQIPTTLLSQVDSSIGGKTGVDFDAYKNMVGAFHMPKLVYINTQTLLSLPEKQFSSGMGEVIKHGLIKNGEYYRWLHEHASEIKEKKLSCCENMVLESDKIKRAVVEDDPTEKGDRALLNFGHTLGHAIEKLMNFQMLHGHCVGLGCLAAAYISALRGYISMKEVEDIKSTMEMFDMPVSVSGLDIDDVLHAAKSDKKMDSGVIKFILLRRIGDAYVDRSVTEDEMREGLKYIFS